MLGFSKLALKLVLFSSVPCSCLNILQSLKRKCLHGDFYLGAKQEGTHKTALD